VAHASVLPSEARALTLVRCAENGDLVQFLAVNGSSLERRRMSLPFDLDGDLGLVEVVEAAGPPGSSRICCVYRSPCAHWSVVRTLRSQTDPLAGHADFPANPGGFGEEGRQGFAGLRHWLSPSGPTRVAVISCSRRKYGFHEVFHTLTIAAFTAHYIAVWIVVHQ
jgi:hypothetical protein